MPRTTAGLRLLLWSESDARALPEYGPWDTVGEAILAIEAEAVGEGGLRSSAQAYVDAVDAAKKAAKVTTTLNTLARWAELDGQARVALADLRKALKAKPRARR
jgi:hypothetical protein